MNWYENPDIIIPGMWSSGFVLLFILMAANDHSLRGKTKDKQEAQKP